MNKPRVTLMDFLHIKKDEDFEEKLSVESETVEEKIEEKETQHIYSVQEVTSYIRHRLDEDSMLSDVYVKGELSNLSQPTSGHLYFTLKDKFSELRCVMFREKNRGLKFTPEDGMSVILRGHISVYERRGSYQLYVDELQAEGIGALYLAFEQLKKKLKGEGLFDSKYKKPIPSFPRKIGIITSPTGAAIRDMLNITKRRFPHVYILVAPVAVQGEDAPGQIVNAIRLMNRVNEERMKIDVLVLGRGGGSIEELWAFNEEAVAREIFASKIPVISAVGHETDFTISDFVADRRAATPSEAAELAVPDKREIERNLSSLELRMQQNTYNTIEYHRKRLESIEKNILFRKPTERINQYRQTVDELKRTIFAASTHLVTLHRKSLQALTGKLDALSPLAILDRGYSICSRLPDGKIVRSIEDVSVGDALTILFADGEATSEVKEKWKKKKN
uniref:Exodeoxyribonuclease 7 large subunit n=1 Tax=Candidatus Methanophaga sp. ANME-1 ERB7 TaxID=2759913 RepID=A0A7G9Z533_9EURY|nr:exodeoxyribonuclease 7 large subunit [Methanosarcinales archaeon ANME-1 ERB7]